LRVGCDKEWLDNPAIVTRLRFDGNIIRNRKLDKYFLNYAWKRHDDRFDYRYWLGNKHNLDHATKQDSTGETVKLYRTGAQWRRGLHSANDNRERYIRH
jgi:hypothetical protein